MRELWTISQRRAIVVLIAIGLGFLSIRLWRNPVVVPERLPESGPAADRLGDRLDPNIATAAELAAIPNLGEKRAQAIVDYREVYLKAHPGHRAFTSADDLEAVKGIGAATAEGMESYLVFPGK